MLRISSTNLASGNFLCTFSKGWRRDGKMFMVMSFGPDFENRYITSCQNTIKWSMTRFPHLLSFRKNSTYANRATEKYVKLRNREQAMQKSGRQRDGNKAASILNCHMTLDQNGPNRRDEKQIQSGKTKNLTSHTERKTPSRRLLNNQDDVEGISAASRSEKSSQETDAERFKTLEQMHNTVKINSNFKMLNSEEMQRQATGLNQARMRVRRLGTSKAVSNNVPSDKADKAFTQFQKMLEVPVSAQMEQFLHEQDIRKKCAPKTTKRRSVNVFKVSDPYVKQRLLKNKVNVEIYNQTHLLNEREPQCEFAEVQCGKKKLYIAFLDDDLSSAKPQQKNSAGSAPPATQRKKSGKSLTNKFMHMSSSQRAKVTPEKMAKIIQNSSGKKGKIMKMIEKLPKDKQGKQRSGGHDKTLKFTIPHKEKNMKVIVNLTKGCNEKSLSPPVIHLLQKTEDGSVGEVLKFQIRKIEKYWFPTDNGRIKIQYLTGALSSIKNKLMEEIPRILKPPVVLEQDQIHQNYRQQDDFYTSPLIKSPGPEMSTGEEGMTGKNFRATDLPNFKRGEKEEPCLGKDTEPRTFFKALKDTSKVNRASEKKKAPDNAPENSPSRKFISFENLFQRMGVKSTRDTEKNISTEVKNPLENGVMFEKSESGTVEKSLMFPKEPEVNKEVAVFQNDLKNSSPRKDVPLNTTDLENRKLPKTAQPAWKEIEKISKEKEAELSQAPPPPQLLDPYFAQVNWHKIRNAAHLELERPAAATQAKHQPQDVDNSRQSQSIPVYPCKLNPVLSGAQSQQTVSPQIRDGKETLQQHQSEVPAEDIRAQMIPLNVDVQRQNASQQWVSPQSTIPLAYNHESAHPQVNHPEKNWIPQNQVEYYQPKEDMQSQQQRSDSSQQSSKAQPEVHAEKCGEEQQEKPEDLSSQENSSRPRSKDFYYPRVTSRKVKTSRLPAPSKMNEGTNFPSMFEGQEHKLIPFNVEVPPIYLDKDIQMYEGSKETQRTAKNVSSEQCTTASDDKCSSADKNWETWKKEQKIPNLRKMIRRSLVNSDVVHSFIIETDTLGECYSAANKLQEFVPRTAVEYNCKYDQEPELRTLENAVAQNFMKISDLDIIQLQEALDWEKKSCDTRQTSLPAVKADSYSEIAANSQSFVDAAADAYGNTLSCGYGALNVSLDQYQASGSGYSYQVQRKVTPWEDSLVSCSSLLEPHIQEAVESEGQYQKNLLTRKLEDDIDTITTTRTVEPSEIAAILNEEVIDPTSRSKSSKSTPSKSLKQTTKTATLPTWNPPAKIYSSGATFKSSAATCANESIPAEDDVRGNISEDATELGVHTERKKETVEVIEKPKPNNNATNADGSDPLRKEKNTARSDPDVKPTELILQLKEELSSRLKNEWKIKDFGELTENVKPLVESQMSPEKRNNGLFLEKFALEQSEVNKQTEIGGNLGDHPERDIKKELRGQKKEDSELYNKSEVQPTTMDLEKSQLDKSKQRDGGCYYGARYGREKKVIEPLLVEELPAEQNLLVVIPSPSNTMEVDQGRVLALEESSSAITMNQRKTDSGDHLPRKDHPYLPNFVDPPQRDTTFTPQKKPRDKDHPYLPNWETNPKQPSRPPHQPHTYPYYYAPPNTEPHPSYQPQHPQTQPSYRPQHPETQPPYNPQQPATHPYYQQPQTQPHYHPQHPHPYPYYQQPQTQPHQPHTRPNYQPEQPQTNPGHQQPQKHNKQEQSPPTSPTDASSCLDQTDQNLNGVSKNDLHSPEFQVEETIHMFKTEFGENMEYATMEEMADIDEYNLLGEQEEIQESRLKVFDILVSITQGGGDRGKVNNHVCFEEFKPDGITEEKGFVESFVLEPKYRKLGKYTEDHKKFKAIRREDEEKTKTDKVSRIKLKELPPAKPQIKKRSEIKTLEVTLKASDKSVDDNKKSEAGDKASELIQTKTNQEGRKGESKKEVAANREGGAKQQKEADGSKGELRNLGMKKEDEEKQEDVGIKRKLGMKLKKEKEVAKDLESSKNTLDTLQEKMRHDVLEEMKRQEEQTKLDEKREQKQREVEEQRAMERQKMEEERKALQMRMAEEAKRKAFEIFGYGTREHEELPKTEPPPKVELKNTEPQKLETSPVIPIPNEKKPEDTKDKVAEEKKIKFPSPEGTSEKKTAGKLEQSNAAENHVKNATMKERFGPGLSKKLKSLLEEKIEKHSANLEKKTGEPKKPEEAIKISDEEKNRIKTPAMDKKILGGETKKAEKEGLKSEVKITPKEEIQKTEKIKTSKPAGKAEEERKSELGKRKSNLADWEKELIDKTSSLFRLTSEPEKFGESKKSAETEKAKKPEEKPKDKLAKSEVSRSDSPLKIDKDKKPENVTKILPDKGDGGTSSDKSPKMAHGNDSLVPNTEPNHYLYTYSPPKIEESTVVAPVTLYTSMPTVNLEQYNNDQYNFGSKGDLFNLYLNQEEWEEMLKLFEKSRGIPAETPGARGNKEQDVKVDGAIGRHQGAAYGLANTVEKGRSQYRKNAEEKTERGFDEYTMESTKAQKNIMNQSPRSFTNGSRLTGDVHCWSQETENNTMNAEYAPISEIYANPTLEQMNIIPMRATEETFGRSEENTQTSESDSNVSILKKVFETDKTNNESKDVEAIANDQRAPGKTLHSDGTHQQELRSCIEILKNMLSSEESVKKLTMERKIPVGTEGTRSKKEIAESELNPYEQFLKMTMTEGKNDMNQTKTENMQGSSLPGKDLDFKLFIELLDRTIANAEKEIRTAHIIQDEQNAKERSGVGRPEQSSSEEVKKDYQFIRFLHLVRNAIDATQNEMNQKWNSTSGAGDTERSFDSFLAALREAKDKSEQKGLECPSCEAANTLNKKMQKSYKSENQKYNSIETEEEKKGKSPRETEQKGKGPMKQDLLDSSNEGQTKNTIGNMVKKEEMLLKKDKFKVEEEKEAEETKKSSEVEKLKSEFNKNLSENQPITGEVRMAQSNTLNVEEIVEKKKITTKGQKITEEERRKVMTTKVSPTTRAQEAAAKKRENRLKLEELEEKVKRREMEMNSFAVPDQYEDSSEPFKVHNVEIIVEEPTTVQYGISENMASANMAATGDESQEETGVKEFTVREEPFDIEVVSIGQRPMSTVAEQTIPERTVRPTKAPGKRIARTIIPNVANASVVRSARDYAIREEEDPLVQPSMKETEASTKADSVAGNAPTGSRKTTLKIIGSFMQKRDLQTLSNADIYSLRKESRIPNRPVMLKLLTSNSNEERPVGQSVLGESLRNRIASLPLRKTQLAQPEKEMATIKDNTELKVVRVVQRQQEPADGTTKKSKEVPCAVPVDPENSTPEIQ